MNLLKFPQRIVLELAPKCNLSCTMCPRRYIQLNDGFSNLIKAESACQSVLSLPIEPLQREEDTLYIAGCVREFFE